MWQILKETGRAWIADKASQLAAALSFYTTISIAPMLVLVVVIVGLLLGRQTAESQLMQQLQDRIGVQGAAFLQTAIDNAKEPSLASWAGILSLLALLWGSTNVFSQLQSSLNTIWGVEPKPGQGIWATIRHRLLTFVLVMGAALLLLASVILSSLLAVLVNLTPDWLPGGGVLWQVINYVVSLGMITLILAAIYKILPDAKIAWRYVWLGAAVTSLLFVVGQAILAWYLSNAGSTYGVVGSLVVFLLWVYYSAQILFFGAEFTQVYAHHQGSSIQPDEHAVRVAKSATA
jgi:membrane protein